MSTRSRHRPKVEFAGELAGKWPFPADSRLSTFLPVMIGMGQQRKSPLAFFFAPMCLPLYTVSAADVNSLTSLNRIHVRIVYIVNFTNIHTV
jgi:hypothetical protein